MPATLVWKVYELPNSTLIRKWNFFTIKYNMHSKVAVKSSCRANSTKTGQTITLSIKYVAKNSVWDLLSYGLFRELFSKCFAICNSCTLKILPWNSRNFLLSFDSEDVTGLGAGKWTFKLRNKILIVYFNWINELFECVWPFCGIGA